MGGKQLSKQATGLSNLEPSPWDARFLLPDFAPHLASERPAVGRFVPPLHCCGAGLHTRKEADQKKREGGVEGVEVGEVKDTKVERTSRNAARSKDETEKSQGGNTQPAPGAAFFLCC